MPWRRSRRPSPHSPPLDQHLGVTAEVEVVATGDQLGTELRVVVDAAVEHDRQAELIVHHGLCGAVGQVDDLQAPVAESDTSSAPRS